MMLPLLMLAAASAHAITLPELLADKTAPREVVYQAGLKMYVFGAKSGTPKPAVIWIHGGGWRGGNPEMFFPHARYYAGRGAVGISIQYRLGNVADCVADTKAAIQYIRAHAAELGVDKDKIVAMGDSAGGHLAAMLGTAGLVNAVAAYNPITDMTDPAWVKMTANLGEAQALSPLYLERPGLPPFLVLHGLNDTVVSPDHARRFCAGMKAAGNRCDLALYEGEKHAFVVPKYTASDATVVRAIREGDQFLVSLNILQGRPSLDVAAHREVFVATNGNDASDGSKDKPFASLERAMEAHADDIVLRAGSYARTRSLTLTAKNNGLTIRAAAGEEVHLIAGVTVPASAMKRSTEPRLDAAARGHVVEIDAAALGVKHLKRWLDVFTGGGGLVELYFNGTRLTLARWPNKGYATMAKVLDNGDWSKGPNRHGGTFVYSGDRPSRWLKAMDEGLWLDGFWRVPWTPEKVRVKAIDTAAKTMKQAEPVNLGIGSKYKRPEGDGKEPWYALNVLEEIDQPGEWSVNFQTGKIYVWLPEGKGALVIADLDAPVIAMKDASAVTIERLQFEGGLGKAIEITGGADVHIAGCDIRNFGGTAIAVNGGVRHTVESNDIHGIGEGGIYFAGGDRKTLTPAAHKAINNHIWSVGEVRKTYAPAISVAFDAPPAVGVTLANNLIHDLPHAAVLYSGNDHLFERNEVHNVALDSGDVGAFYTTNDWTSRGNVLRHNFVHHVTGGNAFYMDDGDCGDTVTGNVIYRTAYGPFIGGGHDNVVRGNLVIEAARGLHMDSRGVARHYDKTDRHKMQLLGSVEWQKAPWLVKYPLLQGIFDKPAYPVGNILEGNAMIDCKEPFHLDKDSQTVSTVRDNVVGSAAEAAFVDAARLDFRLRPGSKVLGRLPGLGEIPFLQIGLYLDAYRLTLPETGRYVDRRSTAGFDSETDVRKN